jgi:hypothetical protein
LSGFGPRIKENLIWTVHANIDVAGRGKKGCDAFLCDPRVPDFFYTRSDNGFLAYDAV